MESHAVDPFGIVGKVLDSQFRVDRLVGEGGFSAVYRGHHLGLDEPIAIKCLKLPPALSPALVEQFAQRFRDESRILYQLSQGNLNIVRSMAAGTWQANTGAVVPYMVLEWLEGRSLANEFTIRRTVGQTGRALTDVVKVFASAADGLAYAHAQGVVHRDLNPGNFFLLPAPQGTRMKVLDFGVAKILDDSTLSIARTQTVGQIRIFAPAYGAPEQFDDRIGKMGAATDVYAFALILLEALRDRPVNDGTHLGEFAQLALDQKRPTPRALGLEVTDEVEQIFARATKLDPRERFQSAGELWQALAIAATAASQQMHLQAAKETPSLGLPPSSAGRTTQAGMGPMSSGHASGQGAPAGRMAKTLPINALQPNMASRPAAVVAPDPPPSEPEDEPTRVGARNAPPALYQEPEEEVTKVRAPEAEMLQAGGRNANHAAPTQAAPAAHPMHPQGMPHGALAQTLPLTGPHPLGLPMQQGSGGPLPAAGAAPAHPMAGPPPNAYPGAQPQPQQAPMPPPHQQHQQQQQQQQVLRQSNPGAMPMQAPYGQPPQGAPALSMPPAGVPQKTNPIVFVVIGLVVLAAVGVGLIALTLGKGEGKGSSTTAAASASAAASSSAIASAPPPPPPPPAPEPTAAAVVEDAGAAEPTADATVDAGSASPSASASSAPTSAPTAPTPPSPGPAPTWTPPTPVAVKDAGPPPDPNAFSESAARSKLSQANGVLDFCKKSNGPTGKGSAMVTFSPEGTVSSVALDPPYAGTPVGDCVARQLRNTKVSSFKGEPKTVKHTFEISK